MYKLFSLIILSSLFTLVSCGNSCDKIGKKTSADSPTREELTWYANNCMGK